MIRLSHRPAQLFQPATDVAEQHDLAGSKPEVMARMFRDLGAWEATHTTAPLWDSSPFWWSDSAQIYDDWKPRPEPK